VLRAVARLRARVLDAGGSEEHFEAAETAGAGVRAACEQLGLFTAARLVLVRGIESWRAEDVAALEPYVAAPSPATTLALVAGAGLKKDHRVRSLVTAKPQVLVFDVPGGRQLVEHLRRESQRLGAEIEPDALRRLVELVGERPVALEQELDKLATFAAGRPIDVATVEELAFRGDDVSPFALTDALSARNRRATFRAVVRCDEAGEKPHALLPQIARHVDLLRRARRALDGGRDHRAFAREAQIHEFRARKLLDAAAAWSERDAATAVVALADADWAMKGGARIDPQLALERALAAGLGGSPKGPSR
jgi:DNA polymerase-3 subunit delta